MDDLTNQQEIKEKGEAIERMVTTEGWKIIKEWLQEQSDAKRLVSADEQNFFKLQAEIRAFQSILDKIDEYVNAKKDLVVI